MAANTTLQQDAAAPGRAALQPVQGSPWLGGFRNMLSKELGDWFGTRRWLIQTGIWVAIINGFVAFILFLVPTIQQEAAQSGAAPPPEDTDPLLLGLSLFFTLAGAAGVIGTIILAQDEIIGEKQSGTAAWILSKPVARAAFILSKLAASSIGIGIFIIGIPAVICYAQVSLAVGHPIDLPSYLAGLVPLALTLLFYLTLTLLLGVVFDQRGPLLGIAFGLFFGASILVQFIPELAQVLPINLPNAGSALAEGRGLPDSAVLPLILTPIWSFLFIVAALWRFQRMEI